MNFFANVDVNTEFSTDTGFEPIPAGTTSLAVIEEASWDSSEYVEGEFINLRWSLLGGDHNNRKVFQKLKVNLEDASKRLRQLNMLAAIDANAGGKLMAAGVEPDDMALTSALTNKTMIIKLDVWEMNGKSGNHIVQVSPGNKPQPEEKPNFDHEDDIPF